MLTKKIILAPTGCLAVSNKHSDNSANDLLVHLAPLKFVDLPTVLMAKLTAAFTLLRVLMFHHHFPDAIDK